MDKLLNFQEAAEALGVSKRTIWRLVHKGIIPVVRVSTRAPRVRLTDIEAYVASNTVTFLAPELV